MKKFPILLLLTACWSLAAAQERPQVPAAQKRNLRTEIIAADSTGELLAQLRNMPNIEIGKGITFRPKNDWFELTMRFRMQNLLALSFDDDALDYIVDKAVEFKLGARGLRSICEAVMMDTMFDIPSTDARKFTVTLPYAKKKIEKANILELKQVG